MHLLDLAGREHRDALRSVCPIEFVVATNGAADEEYGCGEPVRGECRHGVIVVVSIAVIECDGNGSLRKRDSMLWIGSKRRDGIEADTRVAQPT
jgi:hypothetical protein